MSPAPQAGPNPCRSSRRYDAELPIASWGAAIRAQSLRCDQQVMAGAAPTLLLPVTPVMMVPMSMMVIVMVPIIGIVMVMIVIRLNNLVFSVTAAGRGAIGAAIDVQRWSRLFKQIFRLDKWSVCQG